VDTGKNQQRVCKKFMRAERAAGDRAIGRPGRGDIPQSEHRQRIAAL